MFEQLRQFDYFRFRLKNHLNILRMQKLSAKMSDILNKENVVFEQNRQKSIWSDRLRKLTSGILTGKDLMTE